MSEKKEPRAVGILSKHTSRMVKATLQSAEQKEFSRSANKTCREIRKAIEEEYISEHILKHPGEMIDLVVKPYHWFSIKCGWYCKKCKEYLRRVNDA